MRVSDTAGKACPPGPGAAASLQTTRGLGSGDCRCPPLSPGATRPGRPASGRLLPVADACGWPCGETFHVRPLRGPRGVFAHPTPLPDLHTLQGRVVRPGRRGRLGVQCLAQGHTGRAARLARGQVRLISQSLLA